MSKILLAVTLGIFSLGIIAFIPDNKSDVTTKIYKYQRTDDAHVFDGVSPYWEEVLPGNECDPIDPTLPCTATIQIGSGSGQFSNLDEFLDQFNSVNDLMEEGNVTGKDE